LCFQIRGHDANLVAVKTIQPGLLEQAVERLKSEFQPEQIWLFGSHAWGTPDQALQHAQAIYDFVLSLLPEAARP
jgi:hypothetical protein